MDADLDTLATALYVKIDNALKMHPELGRPRPELGLCPKLSDAELLTLCVIQALLEWAHRISVQRLSRTGCAEAGHARQRWSSTQLSTEAIAL